MREFLNRLVQQPATTSDALSGIFGSTSADIAQALADLNRPRLRIGLWPIISDVQVDTAMGLATILGFLLERWQEVRVYRLFARLEGTPEGYNWSTSLSQFGVDDWQLEGLDENIAIWGALDKDEASWKLTLQVESDLVDNVETVETLVYSAQDISELVGILPRVAVEIAGVIEAGEARAAIPAYSSVATNDEKLHTLLGRLFQWELGLLLQLWGKQTTDDAILSAADELLRAGQACGDEFAAWGVSSSIARAMSPIFAPLNDLLVPTVDDIVSSFPGSMFPVMLLGTALFRSGRGQTAYNLLEGWVESSSDNADVWLLLADLYRQGGYFNEAVDTFQRAIESDATNSALYTRYGELMLALDNQGWGVEEFILVDPGRKSADLMTWEAVEAFQAALELDPTNVDARYSQVIQLAGLGDERLWDEFGNLVELDKSGERVRNVLESLYHVENIAPAIEALKNAIQRQPERYDLHLNLGVAYLVTENWKLANTALSRAYSLTDDSGVRADIDRLRLAADDPDFEGRLGEITDLVRAGSSLSIKDVDFLEATLVKAPQFVEVYLLLARAYQMWGEPDAVLETLLDGQRNLPDDPDILEMLARTLWTAGERKLAFDYLNRGLVKNPQHVPLLALAGRYLFENGQVDAARVFLTRAEAIAPRHPALNEVRVYISSQTD